MFDGSNLFYMAPMLNAPYIAQYGIMSFNTLRSHPELAKVSGSIAHPFVNARRHGRLVGHRSLHDYVPLYWVTHTPMQYVVTIRDRRLPQQDLVFFLFDARLILQLPGVWTTDGNAASSETRFYEGTGALTHLDWGILNTPNCFSKEYKRRKCAEVLVPDMITRELINSIAVYNQQAANNLIEAVTVITQSSALIQWARDRVIPRPEFYY
ncbi:MAG: DUF4433 domain-containing protein [Blastocatellia bacterium]|nr:DUF4433 domain-containing protein [Blastocatellia bacterium]